MTEKKKKGRAEIEAEVRQKVDCEEKAFRWVEHLALVDSISEEELEKMMKEIRVCHYHDINEERAISKVCGYPLCSVKLGKRSPHKYHISMKYNKVINLSVRENFCSLYCFQANKFIEDQIPQLPIWLRDGRALDIKLLPRENVPKQCEIGEVPLGIIDYTGKHSADKENEKGNTSESDSSDDDKSLYGCLGKGGIENDIFEEHSKGEIGSVKAPEKTKKSNERKQTKLIDHKDIVKRENKETHQYLTKVTEILKEWFTKKSCKHFNLLSKECYDSDDEIDEENCFPESGNFQVNVMNFLSRQPEWISESNTTSESKENKNDKSTKKKFVLPTVDSRSQNSIRQRIVHEKLAGSLREVLPLCGLREEDLTQVKFFKLVDTFNFTSKNIVLNAKQWMVMTIILLKLFSRTYKMDFGDIRNRRNDINNFLIMRSLPNVSQLEEIIKTILDNIKLGDIHGKDDTVIKNKYNNSKTKSEDDVDGVKNKDDSSYYYDNMEEVD